MEGAITSSAGSTKKKEAEVSEPGSRSEELLLHEWVWRRGRCFAVWSVERTPCTGAQTIVGRAASWLVLKLLGLLRGHHMAVLGVPNEARVVAIYLC